MQNENVAIGRRRMFFLERIEFYIGGPLYTGSFVCLLALVDRDRGLLVGSILVMMAGYIPVGWLTIHRGARRDPPREGAVRAAILAIALLPLGLLGLWPRDPTVYGALAVSIPTTMAAMLAALLAVVLIPPLRAGWLRTALLLAGTAVAVAFVAAFVVAVRRFAPYPNPTPTEIDEIWVVLLTAPIAMLLAGLAVWLGLSAFRPVAAPPAPETPASP